MQQKKNTNSSLKDFKIISLLGSGSFSNVYKVIRTDDQKIYALKKVQIDRLNDREK